MRKYISIGLVVTLLFLNGGYYLWFSILQYQIRYEVNCEIAQGVDARDLTLIEVPAGKESMLEWTKAGKEFRYKEEMYDVVRTSVQPQKKSYFCIKDKKEKQLVSHFYKHQKAKKDLERKIKRTFGYKFFFRRFSLEQTVYSSDVTFAPFQSRYKSPVFDVHSPPPRNA